MTAARGAPRAGVTDFFATLLPGAIAMFMLAQSKFFRSLFVLLPFVAFWTAYTQPFEMVRWSAGWLLCLWRFGVLRWEVRHRGV